MKGSYGNADIENGLVDTEGGKERVGNIETVAQKPIYIGEGNGTPLQYSCLENPMDRGAWYIIICKIDSQWEFAV